MIYLDKLRGLMKTNIIHYDETQSAWWDAFVEGADNGTMFHLRRFLGYHPPERFKDNSLIFEQKGKPVAIMPAIDISIDKEKILYSHRGASYGGIVYADLGIERAFALIEQLKSYASENGFNRIVVTTPPIVYQKTYSNYIDFAMLQNGFRYVKREISSVVKLPGIDTDPLTLFKSEARTATRKSVKTGVDIRRTDDYEAYYQILSQNLMLRHNVRPTHTLAELKSLVDLFPERIHLWGAYLNGKMIAGVVNFLVTPHVALAFYISDDKAYQEYRSVNQLFYEIFKWCSDNSYQYYDFGIFTVNMNPNWGLGKFKESFGARGLFRDTFECLIQ
jgi:hypothetical protein